jgi:serine/threonine-protein kinase HipA
MPPNRCPIAYDACETQYSKRGLHQLSKMLNQLQDIPFTAEELRKEAAKRAGKNSIQGVQTKLSATLNVKESRFDLVDIGSRYIFKPQSHLYTSLPENEDLTMRLAREIVIEVPLHGMIYGKDGALTYFIKRFDRIRSNQKLHIEDFAQLAGETRETKYDYSMEKLLLILERHCTAPVVEKAKLLKRVIFNFLIGNEDMHLKNFSLITDEKGLIKLAPGYDFLNTTIAISNRCKLTPKI